VRPGGRRFGTLVHALLASVPIGTGDEALARLANAQGRVLGATSEEVTAAGDAVRRVMRHPVMQQAADAQKKGLCHRETPVTWRLSDRALVEGYVDLAYVVDDEVVVVEFKTDRELAGALETYCRQVQVYAAAVGSALGRRPRAVLMRV
jgi:ATP-dependent helicase/nuclease subunit A